MYIFILFIDAEIMKTDSFFFRWISEKFVNFSLYHELTFIQPYKREKMEFLSKYVLEPSVFQVHKPIECKNIIGSQLRIWQFQGNLPNDADFFF